MSSRARHVRFPTTTSKRGGLELGPGRGEDSVALKTPDDLAALLSDEPYAQRFERAVALALGRLSARGGWLYERHLPSLRPGAKRRIGPTGRAPETLDEAAIVKVIGDGKIRPLDDDGPLTGALEGEPALMIPLYDGALVVGVLIAIGASQTSAPELQAILQSALVVDRRIRTELLILDAVEQSADPIELTDKSARIIYVNRAWQAYTGYRGIEAVGAVLEDLFRDAETTQLHDEAFYKFAMDTLRQGKAWTSTLISRGKQGQRLLQEVTVSPIKAGCGEEVNMATRRDVGPRAERETALMQAHHEFRTVLAAMPDGVAVLRDQTVVFANEALLTIFGLPLDRVIARPLVDLVHPEWQSAFLEALGDEGATAPRAVRFMRADGSVRFCEITSAGRVSFDGKPAAIVLARDLSEHKLAQEQLALADRLTAMGALAAGVAHEINNPLAYVLGNLEVLKESAAERLTLEGDREALDEALEGVMRIRRIVADLKSFSRAEGETRLEAVDVTSVLTGACNIVLNEIRHRARLVRDFEPGVAVLAQEGPLLQVFVNLLVNAAHAIPEDGGGPHEIRVRSVRLGDSRVSLSVSDSGSGIPEHIVARVFEPFFTTKAKGVGSGLGLPISQRIIHGFGGEIRVDSVVGKGTTVTVELAAAAPALPRSARPRSNSLPAVRRGRILLVDDEPSVAMALSRLLREHEVAVAHDGPSALGRLAEDPRYDLIVCDVMMPGMTGVDVYEQARARWPELADRFVFTSGGTFTDRTTRFFERQARTLEKPFDPERVRQLVREVLGAAPPDQEKEHRG
jgi:PAS domain S-box-containing protein